MSAFLILTLRAMRRRIVLLLSFAAVFLLVAAAARLFAGDEGHMEIGRIFEIGGTTLASAVLLLGWMLGRFPLIATLVLMAGVFSHDRAEGYARIWATRGVSPLVLYYARIALLGLVAFLLSALLLPTFDLLMLGEWAGPATLVLIAAYVVVYGSLVALLSVLTRGDAWIALLLGILAISWHALRSAGVLDTAPAGAREVITVLLPPHGALFALENAFGALQPIPWDAFLYTVLYGVFMLVLAGVAHSRREI